MTKPVWYSETKFTPNQDIHNNGTVLGEANSGHATYGLVRDAIGVLYESYEGEVRTFRQLDSFRTGPTQNNFTN